MYIEMANCRLVANRVYTLSGGTSPRYIRWNIAALVARKQLGPLVTAILLNVLFAYSLSSSKVKLEIRSVCQDVRRVPCRVLMELFLIAFRVNNAECLFTFFCLWSVSISKLCLTICSAIKLFFISLSGFPLIIKSLNYLLGLGCRSGRLGSYACYRLNEDLHKRWYVNTTVFIIQ